MLYAMSAKSKIRDRRSPVATAVGARVKACRIEADKSQEELAYEACLDRTRVSAIERGVANPTVETLATICYVLGITLSDLFEPLTLSLKPSGEHRTDEAPRPRRRPLR
ncbi:XRE family transcriptional regulator [Burkholderia pseudomallei]|uniref:helix-turn-helix transcriptional regulator n=1 Tax=Burkholderia pseudomallei TaxID=28450 RepID=UPI000F0614F0|nr:helix-turn-helix transcriptional regulator [Burkholderia pseudomallei]CAJ3846113.1 XRE family transcriptional regulator [Burkholderia pseudomallei]CAJ4295743.1 XRE family transcriptional regulator [Burkholderia pseudomallei]CAJ4318548.1 XRE family transcriptional regulator [Burkholderia pseudomallei]CAJ4324651.1 XRE family transcriptional regulator [Burkholderia pseudomallei]CAJ4502497.1 XRE family transcriptional regulator [Burkholderia pseudomallei]